MRAEKTQLLNDLQGLLTASSGAFLMAYKGTKVSEFSTLRKGLAEVKSECHVVPNRLMKRAADGCGLTALGALRITGETLLVSGGADPVKVAKLLADFGKEHKSLTFKLGVLSGKLLTVEDTKALAQLPSREILLAQVLGLLQATPRQLVTVLSAKVASVVYALKAYADKKEQAA